MNVILKKKQKFGSINLVKKRFQQDRKERDLSFDVGKMPRDILERMLVVCGRVGSKNIEIYRQKAKEIGASFVEDDSGSWVFTHRKIRDSYDPGYHEGVLLIGTAKELPSTRVGYQDSYAFTDWFLQDIEGDGFPDIPVGRVYGPPQTVLYHMDPTIIDSDIAIVFDSEPGRSMRHVEGLASLGFDVEILERFHEDDNELMAASEFILQFSDGMYTRRIHGTPDRWASHNSVILSHTQAESIPFKGYPVIFSEACSTAQEGPLLSAFLNGGACYIGSTLDTMNNIEEYEDWRDCPYADGWKFGFLDLLDSYSLIGQVKTQVDRELYERLPLEIQQQIESIRMSESHQINDDKALSLVEWVLYGNPLRRTTVGPDADYTPGRLLVDT
ncbi:MAG: hypothetical protein BAJATHORv1_40101 [Candidatus Thorarchaeota archaeon]|nr:MAG: hypothetical protein BAJATHORv1_40101 [Candidatus Thorarchaeota archaeon]